MRTDLDHLPIAKRRELAFVVEVLTSEFAREVATRASPHLNSAQILKIVLFGSYAREDWVEDPVGRYFSDYDLLIVVDKEKLTDVTEFWEEAEQRLLNALVANRDLKTPVNFIVHTIEDVNEQLKCGRYFFVDIIRDGIAIVDLVGHPFAEPHKLLPQTALSEAESYFGEWMPSAKNFAVLASTARDHGMPKEAAFLLHQAAERLYTCLLLVETLYTTKSHNLVRLRQLAEPLDSRLQQAWPRQTRFERRAFNRVRRAYVEARYSRHYQVTTEELDWISQRVTVLQALVEEICIVKITALRKNLQEVL